MKTFHVKRIVVPTSFSDKSDAALRQAIDLAVRTQADILLVHVIEPASRDKSEANEISASESKRNAREKLKELTETISLTHGLNATWKVYRDNLYGGIYRGVKYFDADLIIMGNEHIPDPTTWFKRSSAGRISVYSKIPVLSISSYQQNEIKVILFPFNDNAVTLQKLEQVKALAKIYDATVHIAAFRNSNKALARSNAYIRAKAVAENLLKDGIWCSTHLLSGDDYLNEILEFAKRLNADLISVAVYPVKSRSKLFSSVAYKKLSIRSNIPVLSVPTT